MRYAILVTNFVTNEKKIVGSYMTKKEAQDECKKLVVSEYKAGNNNVIQQVIKIC